MDAAYNLARWLIRNEHDAEDAVQEAYLRAFHFFDGFHGADGRPWLLAIVRNTCFTWLRKNRAQELMTAFDDEMPGVAADQTTPESLQLRKADSEALARALDQLPAEFREVLILREMEGMSYREISEVAAVPIGTVMSRLARARKRMQQDLARAGATA